MSLTPFAAALCRHRAAVAYFNALPDDFEVTDHADWLVAEQAHLDAYDEVTTAPIADWSEFTGLLAVLSDDGQHQVDEHRTPRLLTEARRLVAEGRA